ncbi:hypothetical protein CLF_107039 [Clonorchis sinensis]|uniref:Uncharacterized protein n=1 Tax=Clonorchis sinensis TaxID=79923 RepID=G7YQC7_CLOSI|nr:hypothetical protein CLF_107039 [Clonorchis sinensis]
MTNTIFICDRLYFVPALAKCRINNLLPRKPLPPSMAQVMTGLVNRPFAARTRTGNSSAEHFECLNNGELNNPYTLGFGYQDISEILPSKNAGWLPSFPNTNHKRPLSQPILRYVYISRPSELSPYFLPLLVKVHYIIEIGVNAHLERYSRIAGPFGLCLREGGGSLAWQINPTDAKYTNTWRDSAMLENRVQVGVGAKNHSKNFKCKKSIGNDDMGLESFPEKDFVMSVDR